MNSLSVKKRWVQQVRFGCAGYCCSECGLWRHASEFLTCACDNKTQFIISGPIVNDEQTYWNNEIGWTSEFHNATTLPYEILFSPLPPGATGIMELTTFGEYVRFLETDAHPTGEEG